MYERISIIPPLRPDNQTPVVVWQLMGTFLSIVSAFRMLPSSI